MYCLCTARVHSVRHNPYANSQMTQRAASVLHGYMRLRYGPMSRAFGSSGHDLCTVHLRSGRHTVHRKIMKAFYDLRLFPLHGQARTPDTGRVFRASDIFDPDPGP